MTSSSFNIFIYTVFLGFIFQLSHGFEVIQPKNRTVSPDGLASIRCEHTAYGKSVHDVRLNRLAPSRNSERTILCQKGKNDCKNIFMHMENSTNYLFILFNTGPEAMDESYECEFTVVDSDVHYTERGRPTRLLPVKTGNNSCTSSHQPALPHWSDQLMWILIGLLVLMFLCICVILFFYIRLRNKNKDHEQNSTYVEMRKAHV